MIKQSKLAEETVFYVPNSTEGQQLLSQMKSSLNRKIFRMQSRGRNEHRKELAQQLTQAKQRYANGEGGYWNGEHASLRQQVPAKYATYFAVYVKRKGPSRGERWRDDLIKGLQYQLDLKESLLEQKRANYQRLLEEASALQAQLLAATTPSWRRVWADVRALTRASYHALISRFGW